MTTDTATIHKNNSYSAEERIGRRNWAKILTDTFYGQPLPAGTVVFVERYSNAGFQGILAHGKTLTGEFVTVSAGNLDPVR